MTALAWRESFRTGIPSVDHEHENLILRINDFCSRISEDCAEEDVYAHLAEIHALVESHFALEERIMREGLYPDYTAHKADHDILLEDIRDIMESVGHNRKPDYGHVLTTRINNWFSGHFSTLDKDFHSWSEI